MPRGEKDKYTAKQKRAARFIEGEYDARGASEEAAERMAWASVSKTYARGPKEKSGGKKKRSVKRRKGRKPAHS